MLREILGVGEEPRIQRRWFHDEFFDLFVWQVVGGEIKLMQLCYGVDSSEHALVWHRDGGFFHDGDSDALLNAPGGIDAMTRRFEGAASEVPAEIRRSVITCLQEYAQQKTPTRRRRFRRAPWQTRSANGPRSER
jgi:hypothetical protein